MTELKQEMIQSVMRGLKSVGIKYEFDEDENVFRFGRSLTKGFFIVKYIVLARSSDYVVRSSSPLDCKIDDAQKTAEAARLVALINRSLPRGNFEIDADDGELSFRHCVECTGLESPPSEFILSAIAIHQSMWERYSPCLVHLLTTQSEAEDALKLQANVSEPNFKLAFAKSEDDD